MMALMVFSKETHTYAVKIGKPVAKKITDNTDLVVSDCVMAGNHIAHIATQNIVSYSSHYLGENGLLFIRKVK